MTYATSNWKTESHSSLGAHKLSACLEQCSLFLQLGLNIAAPVR